MKKLLFLLFAPGSDFLLQDNAGRLIRTEASSGDPETIRPTGIISK
ncbi:MAG: hypothetical protein ACLUGU_05240 [Alistipes shahii]